MKNKEIKITVPDGYEIDKENSTFECIKFKPKSLTYEMIAKSLFMNRKFYYTNHLGQIYDTNCYIIHPNNGTSVKQLEKLLAINKLMNVAKYLNGDWKPNWKDEREKKWYMRMELSTKELDIEYVIYISDTIVYFKTKELVQQAIDILGKDTICLALSTDW